VEGAAEFEGQAVELGEAVGAGTVGAFDLADEAAAAFQHGGEVVLRIVAGMAYPGHLLRYRQLDFRFPDLRHAGKLKNPEKNLHSLTKYPYICGEYTVPCVNWVRQCCDISHHMERRTLNLGLKPRKFQRQQDEKCRCSRPRACVSCLLLSGLRGPQASK
jgi:hypothetical protein